MVFFHALLGLEAHHLFELLQEGCKVCWTSKDDSFSCPHVSIKHPLDALYLRIGKITVEGETEMLVIDSRNKLRLSTKTIQWEHSRVIVRGNDIANISNCLHVFIWSLTIKKVETVSVLDGTI
jgi:hypothetical protein